MNIVSLIRQKYGDSCQLCAPLDKSQYDRAQGLLPAELFEILKISNGINEVMILPNIKEIEIIDSIVYSLEEIESETEFYFEEYGNEGFVFAGNGAGGLFILKPDGKVYLCECSDIEEYYADGLWDYFNKL